MAGVKAPIPPLKNQTNVQKKFSTSFPQPNELFYNFLHKTCGKLFHIFHRVFHKTCEKPQEFST
jgi:hypothetical protein